MGPMRMVEGQGLEHASRRTKGEGVCVSPLTRSRKL